MKYTLPDGQELKLKPLGDSEFDRARKMAPRSLDVCPTCGGREEYVAPGIKHFVSKTYRFRGEEHQCNCLLQIALYARYLLAGIGDQFMRLDWADYDGQDEADKWVRDYIENWEYYERQGMGLTLSSPVQGVGKTWAATTVGKEMIKRRQRVYFIDFIEMVNRFCGEYNERRDIEDRLYNSQFVILDDVRSGISDRQQDLYAAKFESVIRHRTNYNRPTLLTTNLTHDRWDEEFPRIASLLKPKQIWIDMNGRDYRRSQEASLENADMVVNKETRPIS